MEKINASHQRGNERIGNLREVAVGLGKKISQENARRCPQCAVATCNQGCPLGIDIPGFIRLLREGDAQGALSIILQHNPFPALCGRVCSAPCETACIFSAEGDPITIRELERFAADHGVSRQTKRQVQAKLGRKIAIIGSGPAGLMAAHQLALLGFEVTIFEASPYPGGSLRYLIPEFRLPQAIVDDIVIQVKQLGVEIQTHALFGRTLSLSEIFMRGFDTVLLAIGSSVPKLREVSGVHASGVYYHVEFLSRLQQYHKVDIAHQASMLLNGTQTVIIGEDLTLFDSARLAKRLGQEVTVIWTGSEDSLTEQALKHVQEEGVIVKEGMQLVRLESDDEGYVSKVVVKDLVEQNIIEMNAQTAVLALGQEPNQAIRQHLPQLRFNEDGSVWLDKETRMTSVEKVFACGTVIQGVSSMVEAMANAKQCALDIKKFVEQK